MRNFKNSEIDTCGRTAGKLKTHCPKCRHTRRDKRDKSLSVNIDTGLYKCHHCQWSGIVPDSSNRNNPSYSTTYAPAHTPESKPAANLKPVTGELAGWLSNIRRIPVETATRMGVSSGEYYFAQAGRRKPCLCFNYLLDGQVVTTKYRSLQKEFGMQTGAPVIPYNIDGIRGQRECIITEGEMDALAFAACGCTNVISVPTGANAGLDWLEPFMDTHLADKDTIYLAVDTDAPGLQLCHNLRTRLGESRCRTVAYHEGCKDANEQLIKHGPDSLLAALKEAPEPPLKGVTMLDEVLPDMDVVFENGLGSGAETGWENLDALCTFERGRLAIITGVPGSGKSEFVDELMVRLNQRHGWRGAFYSPENMPLIYHASKLIEKLAGRKFRKDVMPVPMYKSCLRYLSENFSFLTPPKNTLDSILDTAARLVVTRQLAVLDIDPWNGVNHQIPPGLSETQYINNTLDRLRTFALRYNCLVLLTAHPRKMNRDHATGRTPIPTLYDINGSAAFNNKADYGFTVERDYDAQVTRIHVRKVRFRNLGRKGEATFVYNLAGGRYTPYDEQDPRKTVYDESCWINTEPQQEELFTTNNNAQ